MTEQIYQAEVSSDELMTQALRACGFHVRTLNLAPGQRPQVVGNIDHATALFQLTVAGTDAAIFQHAAALAVDGNDVIVDRRDLFDFLRSAWRDGQDHGGEMDEVDRWSRGSDYANKVIEGWSTLRSAAVPAASVPADTAGALFARQLIDSGAENYIGQVFDTERGDIEVIASYISGKTPAQKLAELEAKQPDSGRDAAQFQAGLRQGYEQAAKALGDRAASWRQHGEHRLEEEVLQCRSMLHDQKPDVPVTANATIATGGTA